MGKHPENPEAPSGIGWAALTALCLGAAADCIRERRGNLRRPGLAYVFSALLLAAHVVQPLCTHAWLWVGALLGQAPSPVPQLEAAPLREDQDLILVNSPNALSFMYLPFLHAYCQMTLPAHIRLLASSLDAAVVSRPDETTLVIRSEGGTLVPSGPLHLPPPGTRDPPFHPAIYAMHEAGSCFRDHAAPLRPGDNVELPGLRVGVDQVDWQGFPLQVTFVFDRPLESDAFVWLSYEPQQERCTPFRLPRVGEKVRLPSLL